MAQSALIALLVLMLALYPPAAGKMILVPLFPASGDGMVARATQLGASLVGAGPLPQSFVVQGDRATLATAMLRRGVLVLAAPSAGCGKRPAART